MCGWAGVHLSSGTYSCPSVWLGVQLSMCPVVHTSVHLSGLANVPVSGWTFPICLSIHPCPCPQSHGQTDTGMGAGSEGPHPADERPEEGPRGWLGVHLSVCLSVCLSTSPHPMALGGFRPHPEFRVPRTPPAGFVPLDPLVCPPSVEGRAAPSAPAPVWGDREGTDPPNAHPDPGTPPQEAPAHPQTPGAGADRAGLSPPALTLGSTFLSFF